MKSIKKYFRKRSDAISTILNRPAKEFTAAKFHKLRVEIKRIHALVGMLAYCLDDYDQKKEFRPFRKLARKAGSVREIQLQKKMTRKYGGKKPVRSYLGMLDADEAAARKRFRSSLDKNQVRRIEARLDKIGHSLAHVGMTCVEEYISSKSQGVLVLKKEGLQEPGQVHEFRKELKDLGYVQESLDQAGASEFDQLAVLIGEWHDCDVFLRKLQEDERIQALDPEEYRGIGRMERKIAMRAKELLNKIVKHAVNGPAGRGENL